MMVNSERRASGDNAASLDASPTNKAVRHAAAIVAQHIERNSSRTAAPPRRNSRRRTRRVDSPFSLRIVTPCGLCDHEFPVGYVLNRLGR